MKVFSLPQGVAGSHIAAITLATVICLAICQPLAADTESVESENGLYVNPAWFGLEGEAVPEFQNTTEPSEGTDAVLDAIGGLAPAVSESEAEDTEPLYLNPEWFGEQDGETRTESESADTTPNSSMSLSEQYQQQGDLSAELVAYVWKMIDRNNDNHASDREEYRAIRPARVFANYIQEEGEEDEHAAIRAEAVTRFDADRSGQLEKGEAAYMLAEIRGLNCPWASRAEQFWASLDSNGNGQLEPAEFAAKLQPLGSVGLAMAGPLSELLHDIDVDRDDQISKAEVYFSANAMLRIQLATEGAGGRNPADWMRFVTIVAALDDNGSNVIEPWEAQQAGMSGSMYTQIDSDGNQQISASEMCSMQDQLNAAAQARLNAIRAARSRSSGGGCCCKCRNCR